MKLIMSICIYIKSNNNCYKVFLLIELSLSTYHPVTGSVVFQGGLPVCPPIVPLNAHVNRTRQLFVPHGPQQQGNLCPGRHPLL